MEQKVFEKPVKGNEVIKWVVREDWLQQLIAHVNAYIDLPRSKSKAHQQFALRLKLTLDQIAQACDKKTAIAQALLPILVKKAGLSEKGFNRKKSYLYTLCDVAHSQYFLKSALEQEFQRLQTENLEKISLMAKEKIEAQTTVQLLSKQILESKAIIEKMQFEEGGQLQEQQFQISILNQQTAALKKEIEMLRANNQKLEKHNQELMAAKDIFEAKIKQAPHPTPVVAIQPQISTDIEALHKEQLANLRNENAKLRQENEEQHLRSEQYVAQLAENYKQIHRDKERIEHNLTTMQSEMSNLQKAYTVICAFVDAVFGKFYSLKFNHHDQPPALNANQTSLIQKIVASPSEPSSELKNEVDALYKKQDKNEHPASKSDTIKTSFQDGLGFLKSITSPALDSVSAHLESLTPGKNG